MKTILLTLFLATTLQAAPPQRVTYRDAAGRPLATSSTLGTRTTFRDASGRAMGTSSTTQGITTYRDGQGRLIGTSRAVPYSTRQSSPVSKFYPTTPVPFSNKGIKR